MKRDNWPEFPSVHEPLTAICFEYEAHLDAGPIVVQLVFLSLCVYVNTKVEDDTVVLSNRRIAAYPIVSSVNVSGYEWIKPFIGKSLIWTRVMTNRFGFTDGVQFDFIDEKSNMCSSIQFLSGCSTLLVHVLHHVTDVVNYGERDLYV